jgi:hypothetical protein
MVQGKPSICFRLAQISEGAFNKEVIHASNAAKAKAAEAKEARNA